MLGLHDGKPLTESWSLQSSLHRPRTEFHAVHLLPMRFVISWQLVTGKVAVPLERSERLLLQA